MDDLPFYVLFNSVSVISGRWEVDNERVCAMELRLRLRRFRLKRAIELSLLDQQTSAEPTELPGLLNSSKIIFFFLNENICCDLSLESSRRDDSNEGSQHMFERSKMEKLLFIFSTV